MHKKITINLFLQNSVLKSHKCSTSSEDSEIVHVVKVVVMNVTCVYKLQLIDAFSGRSNFEH